MEVMLKLDKKIKNGELLIRLEGRLDTNTAPDLEKELNGLDKVTSLIFDFKNLDYISSAGLRIILSLQKVMNNQGSMVIKNVKNEVREVFEITGLSDILNIE